MALINHRAREIHFKIVYYGAGLCGKTTNLRRLHDRLPPERRGRLISIATDHERTLFFDFLPIELGQIGGLTTRFHLYTVPGQVYYRLSRRAVLQGLDGIVFVADSHPAREDANRESLADLGTHLVTLGLSPEQLRRLPWVFQYNKRDVAAAVPVERLRAALNPGGAPEFETIASEGKGVAETLRAICKAVLARLASEAGRGEPAPAAAGASSAPPAPPGALAPVSIGSGPMPSGSIFHPAPPGAVLSS
jgi:signal recognition particle receptor subunit beta